MLDLRSSFHYHRLVRTFAALLLVSTMGLGCGSTPPTAASPSNPQPSPAVPAVNFAGSWSGTLESSNFPTRTVTMTVVQDGACVDGVWQTDPPAWTGAISGYAGPDSFSGQISVEMVTNSGEKCSGVGDTNGHVDTQALRWTSAGFFSVAIRCNPLPQSVVLTLHRT
jgi:hypothetical protein